MFEDTLGAHYHFTHKSGRKVIAQTSTEFHSLQMGKEWSKKNKTEDKLPVYLREFEKAWGGGEERLGYKEWRNWVPEFTKVEDKLNKFWAGAKGFEKLFKSEDGKYSRLTSGWYGCPLKRFLAEIQNQAIMEGNMEQWQRAYSLMPSGNQLLLTY